VERKHVDVVCETPTQAPSFLHIFCLILCRFLSLSFCANVRHKEEDMLSDREEEAVARVSSRTERERKEKSERKEEVRLRGFLEEIRSVMTHIQRNTRSGSRFSIYHYISSFLFFHRALFSGRAVPRHSSLCSRYLMSMPQSQSSVRSGQPRERVLVSPSRTASKLSHPSLLLLPRKVHVRVGLLLFYALFPHNLPCLRKSSDEIPHEDNVTRTHYLPHEHPLLIFERLRFFFFARASRSTYPQKEKQGRYI